MPTGFSLFKEKLARFRNRIGNWGIDLKTLPSWCILWGYKISSDLHWSITLGLWFWGMYGIYCIYRFKGALCVYTYKHISWSNLPVYIVVLGDTQLVNRRILQDPFWEGGEGGVHVLC